MQLDQLTRTELQDLMGNKTITMFENTGNQTYELVVRFPRNSLKRIEIVVSSSPNDGIVYSTVYSEVVSL